jgi:hypothetical protein
MNKIQQGDVLFRLVTLPKGKQTVLAKKRCVLAEGEHTGHAHVVEDDEAELVQIGEKILLTLTKEATVKHEEHKPVTLSPGIWEIGRVKEYDYFSQMVRQVAD